MAAAQKVKSAWGETPELIQKSVRAGAFMGALLVAMLTGGVAFTGFSDATGLDTPHLDQIAAQAARIDTVVAEQKAARARDVEQTRALQYLTCAMRVARGNSSADCEALFIDGQIGGMP